MPPVVRDPGHTTTVTDSDEAQNREEIAARSGSNLVEYDLENWKFATLCATAHGLVAVWGFESIIVDYPSRVCGWEETVEHESRLPAAAYHENYMDLVYYHVQDWEDATRRAADNNRILKHVFDVTMKQAVASIYRVSTTSDRDSTNRPPPPPPPSSSSRHRVMLPPRYSDRRSTPEAVHPERRSPPPRYTSLSPGPEAPPPRYTSRAPERTQRQAPERTQHRALERSERRASPQPRHGRD